MAAAHREQELQADCTLLEEDQLEAHSQQAGTPGEERNFLLRKEEEGRIYEAVVLNLAIRLHRREGLMGQCLDLAEAPLNMQDQPSLSLGEFLATITVISGLMLLSYLRLWNVRQKRDTGTNS